MIYRSGLRTALGIRSNINNEIIYTESGKYPLKCRIAKQQLKFWMSLKDYVAESPESALKYLLDVANEIDLPYIKWYKNLESEYGSPATCKRNLETSFTTTWKTNFDNAVHDIDSRLGTYTQVNPTLSTPKYIDKIMFETDRLILTRFRCGSHSLLIEKGRYTNIPRCDRLCSCGTGIQNVIHCFTTCPSTLPLLEKRYTSLREVFEEDNICVMLHKVCKELKIPV